jgi:predicted secreted protein
VGALELETVTMELSVPAVQLMQWPFNWYFHSSDLSTSVQKVLTAFMNESSLYVKYLPDNGVTPNAGNKGACVVTDCSLSGGIDAMNTFSVSLQGTGAATAV